MFKEADMKMTLNENHHKQGIIMLKSVFCHDVVKFLIPVSNFEKVFYIYNG